MSLLAAVGCQAAPQAVGPSDPDNGSENVAVEPATVEQVERYLAMEGFLGDVYFEDDSAALEEGWQGVLERQAELLRRYPNATLALEGHTDERGPNDSNMALAGRRASTVAEFLTARGIGEERFQITSWGEERPICTESNEDCWARNNRVRIALMSFDRVPLKEVIAFAEKLSRRSVYWNAWPSRSASAVPSLEVGLVYQVTFDLAPYEYGRLLDQARAPEAGAVDATAGAAELTREIQEETEKATLPDEARVSIWAQPVLLGSGLEFAHDSGGAIPGEIESRRLRYPPPVPSAPGSLAQLGSRLGALRDGDRWTPFVVDVEAVSPGCAAVALSIWNGRPDKPIDYVIRRLSVGGVPCPAGATAGDLPQRLLTRFGADSGQGEPQDAALHVFEMRLAGGKEQSVAVYVQRAAEGASPIFHSWVLGESLSNFVSHEEKLLRALNNSREALDGYDFAHVSDRLKSALFSGDKKQDRDKAKVARAAFEALLKRRPAPRFYARLVDGQGQSVFLPLGLLEFDDNVPLGSRAVITQPLISENFAAKPCVRKLTFVLPAKLDDVDDSYLEPPAVRQDGLIRTWEDFEGYARQTEPETEGLVLLAHHEGGAIRFLSGLGSLSHGEFAHEFEGGGFAVLVSCATGGLALAEDRLGWVVQLEELGVDAMILSPFDVEAVFGARFANHFARQIEAASQRPWSTTLRQLFLDTVESLGSDETVGDATAEAWEFLIAGDGEIALCGAGARP